MPRRNTFEIKALNDLSDVADATRRTIFTGMLSGLRQRVQVWRQQRVAMTKQGLSNDRAKVKNATIGDGVQGGSRFRALLSNFLSTHQAVFM